jgi:hypothetical protein
MKVSWVALVVAGSAGLLWGACGSGAAGVPKAERSNEQLLTSLPVFVPATLVREYILVGDSGPTLTREYATYGSVDSVTLFYERQLEGLGWQPSSVHAALEVFAKEGAEVDLSRYGPQLPGALPQATIIAEATPPDGTSFFFAISVQAGQ